MAKGTLGSNIRERDVCGGIIFLDTVPQKGKEAGDVKTVEKWEQRSFVATEHLEQPCCSGSLSDPHRKYDVWRVPPANACHSLKAY